MSARDLVLVRNDDPLVTIAIPTFNRAAVLKGCITAALAQTYGRFELLVSDNASLDETQIILNSFGDDRLRIIRQKTNIGLLPNYNACLEAATGDYIVFVADDDRIAPHLLERCINLVRRQPRLPVVITLSNLHAVSFGKIRPPRASRSHPTGIWDGADVLTDFLTDQITVTMCGVMLRTDLLRMNGGLPLDYPHTADVAAWAPLLLLGEAGLVNEACATYSYHGQSETARMGVEQVLLDAAKTANLISQMADRYVHEPGRREKIKIEARRFFARRSLTALSDYRNSGGEAQNLLNFLWRFRHDLHSANLKSVLRFVATILCPQIVADRIRRSGPGATVPIINPQAISSAPSRLRDENCVDSLY